MKKSTAILLVLVVVWLKASAQTNPGQKTENGAISLVKENWQYPDGKAEFLERNGQKIMRLKQGSQGPAILKNTVFRDGTIEFDFEPTSPMSLSSSPTVYFRGNPEENNAEIFYIRARPDRPTANDAIQYAPVLGNVNLWDLYPEYQAPALFGADRINHLKMIVSGHQMRVYINNMTTPALEIPKLEGRTREGIIALDGGVTISNMIVKHGMVDDLPSVAAPDLTNHDAHYIRNWSTTTPTDLPTGNDVAVANLPKPENFTGTIIAERKGMINLTRKFGGNASRKLIWLKATITSAEAMKNAMQLGFSDEVWVFLNGQMVFLDKNLYLQPPMRKQPDGRISIQNAKLNLSLRQGNNELLIGLANDFYGWGIIARLENMEGIRFER